MTTESRSLATALPVGALRERPNVPTYVTPGRTTDKIARRHFEQIEILLKKLRALREEHQRMVEECGHSCVGQRLVIKVLSDHRHCTADH